MGNLGSCFGFGSHFSKDDEAQKKRSTTIPANRPETNVPTTTDAGHIPHNISLKKGSLPGEKQVTLQNARELRKASCSNETGADMKLLKGDSSPIISDETSSPECEEECPATPSVPASLKMDPQVFARTRLILFAKLEPKLPRYHAAFAQLCLLQKLPDPAVSGQDLIQRRIWQFEVRTNRKIKGVLKEGKVPGQLHQQPVSFAGFDGVPKEEDTLISPRRIVDIMI